MMIKKIIFSALSFLLLAAHFYRAEFFLLSVLCVLIPFLLLFRKAWIDVLMQFLLILGLFEWLRTIWYIVNERLTQGEPWIRFTLILSVVALFTLYSILVLEKQAPNKETT